MSETEKAGFFKRIKRAAREAWEEEREKKRAAEEAEQVFYAEAEETYGRLVASEIFAGRRIELFEGGYVRVGGAFNKKGGPPRDFDSSDYTVPYDAPFERLRAIRTSTQVQEKSAGGRAVDSVRTFGLSDLTSNEHRHIFLTIATDRETYSMHEKGEVFRATDELVLRLELAGQGILDTLAAGTPQPSSAAPAAARASVPDHLRDLAALHRDGVLTDEEFASAKARLLG